MHWVMSRQHYEPVVPLLDGPDVEDTATPHEKLGTKRRMEDTSGHGRRDEVQHSSINGSAHVRNQKIMDTCASPMRKSQRKCAPG